MTDLKQRMSGQITQWQTAQDDRAIFLQCYAMMTANMLEAVRDEQFIDNVWVTRLIHDFAEYYFVALTQYDAQEIPPVWHDAFERACSRRAHVLQNLLLGVNAHICYDLIFAMVDMLEDEWQDLSAEQRDARYRDYCHVNEIIAQTLDAVQDEVVETRSTIMAVVDDAFGRLDEWAIHQLIKRWREQVWGQALVYLSASPTDRPALQRAYAEKANQRARVICGQDSVRGLIDLL
ncbi:MAG: DUF5995 family protein [Anaerolineae bacterium]